jgi:hypothetical protein
MKSPGTAMVATFAIRWENGSAVFLPMVVQIRETMVLQEAELDGRVKSMPFWIFGS